MTLLMIAILYDLADVHEGCNNLLKDMKLETLSETVHLEELDLKNVRHFLFVEQRIERLETFLDMLYPQFMGLVGCLLWLLHEARSLYRGVQVMSLAVNTALPLEPINV